MTSIGDAVSLPDILNELLQNWSIPRKAKWSRGVNAPALRCTFMQPSSRPRELRVSGVALPSDLANFWRLTRSARLFEDATYGQWGLEIFAPEEVETITSAEIQKRRQDYRKGDIVVGRFLGDSDLLIVRADPEADDFGSVLIGLPLDKRKDWYHAAASFEGFLAAFAGSEGSKYWEQAARGGS